MNRDEYLKLVADRFRKYFPDSHLIISQEISICNYPTQEWSFWIKVDELPDLKPEVIYEKFETFQEMDQRLSWHMYRINSYVQGIKEENANECC